MTLPWGDEVSFNYKCIFVSLGAALFYWFAPPKNKFVLVFLLYICYLLLAWYDHWYGCAVSPLKPTFLYSFYGALKPKDYRRAYDEEWQPETKRLVFAVDMGILVVLLACVPAFLRWRPH